MRDIWDTERWKKDWYGVDGEYEGDRSGVTLSFCSDGVNPYKSMHEVYSMWPLMITVMNLPIALPKSIGGILLLGIENIFFFKFSQPQGFQFVSVRERIFHTTCRLFWLSV